MLIKTFLLRYFLSLLIFLGIDALWLGFISKDLYSRFLGPLLKENPNYIAALIFYLLYPIGIVVLSINPGLKNDSLTVTLLNGALLGLIAYSAYDLTNLATLKGWPVQITVIDIAWGIFITGITSGLTFLILK